MSSKHSTPPSAPATSSNPIWDIIVIGGGPAGMMAAGRAAERARLIAGDRGMTQSDSSGSFKVLLLEKNENLGKKLLITGGGRCNVTNAEFDNRKLLAKFKDDGKFLFSPFAQFNVADALKFFNSRGMPTKVEAENRVFPTSDSARSVWEVMRAYLKENQVTVKSASAVDGFVQKEPGQIEAVRLKSGEVIPGRAFILATGGKSHPETGSTGEGFAWLKKLGHRVAESEAALVPIAVADAWVKKISGVSLPTAKVTIFQNDVKQSVHRGKVLFTHFGLSGPAILNMSAEVGELLSYGEVVLSLDLLPHHDYATLNAELQKLFASDINKKFKNAIGALVPAAFVPVILERSHVNPDTACHSVTREERLSLVKLLKDIHIRPTRLMNTDRAIVTSGGVELAEVDWKTMRSCLISNLYLVGDVLNIDRPSGGYSLQICWTTGFVAGSAAAEACAAAPISPFPESRLS
jgi:predicted Rossmann fold flavoprotein